MRYPPTEVDWRQQRTTEADKSTSRQRNSTKNKVRWLVRGISICGKPYSYGHGVRIVQLFCSMRRVLHMMNTYEYEYPQSVFFLH